MKTIPEIWREEAPETFFVSGYDNGTMVLTDDFRMAWENTQTMTEITDVTPGELYWEGYSVEDRPERGNYEQVYLCGDPGIITDFDPCNIDITRVNIVKSSNMSLEREIEVHVVNDHILNVSIWGGTSISIKFKFGNSIFHSVTVEDVVTGNADQKMEELVEKSLTSTNDLERKLSWYLYTHHHEYLHLNITDMIPEKYLWEIVEDFTENKGFRDETY